MTHGLDELRHLDATEQSAQIRAGKASATELTSAHLAAIERLDDEPNYLATSPRGRLVPGPPRLRSQHRVATPLIGGPEAARRVKRSYSNDDVTRR